MTELTPCDSGEGSVYILIALLPLRHIIVLAFCVACETWYVGPDLGRICLTRSGGISERIFQKISADDKKHAKLPIEIIQITAKLTDERLEKILKTETRSKSVGLCHYRCCFPKTKTEKHLTCHSL